jgi:predicted MPP superfamily phosphohydrolase
MNASHQAPLISNITRRQMLKGGALLTASAMLPRSVFANDSDGIAEITREDITITNLPPEFDGFKITLASDFHSSESMPLSQLKRIVKQINDLKSDVILLPGDFVSYHTNEFPPIMEAFSELKAPFGVYASTGNHDHDVNVDLISGGLEEIGITMLRNDNFRIRRGKESLYLLGIDDDASDSIDSYLEGKTADHLDAMFKGIPNDAATIVLCHKPYKFDEYAQTGISLMLSGHTHGGQIVLGRIGRKVISLCSLASEFVDGLYEKVTGKIHSKMYVSRGLGVVDIPFRLNCPPEIVQFTLRSPLLTEIHTLARKL